MAMAHFLLILWQVDELSFAFHFVAANCISKEKDFGEQERANLLNGESKPDFAKFVNKKKKKMTMEKQARKGCKKKPQKCWSIDYFTQSFGLG